MSELQPGLYERLVTQELGALLDALPPSMQAELVALEPSQAPHVLARYLQQAMARRLQGMGGDDAVQRQIDLTNRVLGLLRDGTAVDLGDAVQTGATQLVGLWPQLPGPGRPAIPLSESALLVNAPKDHRIGHEIRSELASADRVDLLCAFLKWTGLNTVRDALRSFLDRGGRLRVITTCYCGATERRVLDTLIEMGRSAAGQGRPAAVEIRVSYDTRGTRLHAKAWLFHRDSGYSTAYVGSSNLSSSALVDGIEWNVRLSTVDAPRVLEKFRATFDTYWEDADFEPYIPEQDGARFDRAIDSEHGGHVEDDLLALVDLHPYPFQAEILERLQVEREVHGYWRNLVVAATGTGKTLIAAFDYKRLRAQRGRQQDRLLFVAHRDHILQQSQRRFQLVLRDGSFGRLWMGGPMPADARHLFASVQTLARQDLAALDPTAFDVIIVDEFHHAEAPTYTRLLQHFKPAALLGLTATPERADGQDVLHWFDGRMAAQLRLWHALERQLLCPFQYFGVADGTDLSTLQWRRGGYDVDALEKLYTADHARVLRILQALHERVLDVHRMRALGFCVSVAHAHFMAAEFTKRGIPSRAVTGQTPGPERVEALRALRAQELNVLFSVDVFSEGVDIPEVDTVLLLRPTESATVFQQQIGRGLRKDEGKSCLTVLDFIGMAHRNFRFDLRYASLLNGTRAEIVHQVEEGFPFLPSGCLMHLERVAQEAVLSNLRGALLQNRRNLVRELRALGPDVGIRDFVRRADVDLRDLYGRGDRSWTELRHEAGFAPAVVGDRKMLGDLRRLLHIDDVQRLRFYRDVLAGVLPHDAWDAAQTRAWTMLHVLLFAGENRPSLDEGLQRLQERQDVHAEMVELMSALEDEVSHLAHDLRVRGVGDVPLRVHCTYALDEILAAFGKLSANSGSRIREGVWWHEASGHDLFFVTLHKSEKDYSPSTMYRDYAISDTLFHWESQSFIREDSPTGRRYQRHGTESGTHALLFIRETRGGAYGTTQPYVFAGPMDYVRHEGERPMATTWRLHLALPSAVLDKARVAA